MYDKLAKRRRANLERFLQPFFSKNIDKDKKYLSINSVIVSLYNAWHYFCLIDSLEALQQQIWDCIYDYFDYYAKTFIFIQNSGMDKLKFTDAFGKNYLMINFIFCKNNGYSPGNTEILQFMLSKPLNKVKESINKLPQKKLWLWAIFLLKPKKQPQYETIALQWDYSIPVLKYVSLCTTCFYRCC